MILPCDTQFQYILKIHDHVFTPFPFTLCAHAGALSEDSVLLSPPRVAVAGTAGARLAAVHIAAPTYILCELHICA